MATAIYEQPDVDKPPRLNPRQKLFADGILAGLNLVKAYRQAGYAEQKTPQMTSAAAYKIQKSKKVERYIAMMTEIAGETIDDVRDRNAGIDDEGISESVLTRVGMLKRLEAIANETYNAKLFDTTLKATGEICKIMGFHKPEQLHTTQVSFMIKYDEAQQDDAADGLPVFAAPAIPRALPIGPASERERLPDDTPSQPVVRDVIEAKAEVIDLKAISDEELDEL